MGDLHYDVSFVQGQRPCHHQPPILVERPRRRQEGRRLFIGLLVLARGHAADRVVVDPTLHSAFRRTGPPCRPASPVSVRFDSFAVPHVFAESDEDAWRSVGYLQARDRLWQMELYRRAASGRLSELLGEATIASTRRFLVLGLRRAAEIEWQRITAEVRTRVRKLCRRRERGDECRPRANFPSSTSCWVCDRSHGRRSILSSIGKLFAWRLGENHRAELLRYELVERARPTSARVVPRTAGMGADDTRLR